MNVIKGSPIVISIDSGPELSWLAERKIIQRTIKRFTDKVPLILSLPDDSFSRALGRRISREFPVVRDSVFLGAENPRVRLGQISDRTDTKHILVIPSNACGMPLASLDLMARVIDDPEVDLAYCSQIIGVLPLLISKKFLRKLSTIHEPSPSNPSSLRPLPHGYGVLESINFIRAKLPGQPRIDGNHSEPSITKLEEFCGDEEKVQRIRLLHDDMRNNPILYIPQQHRDGALAHYLLEKVPALEGLLHDVKQLPVSELSGLAVLFKEFCDTFAITYPIYKLTGQPEIPEEIRKLTSAPKSVGDCYLRAIHFTKFLKQYAGLRDRSRVLDIGCGWGVLALGVANLIEAPGSYLGLDVQKDAINWTQENIAPLNPRFSFVHLDIANSAYNPKGSIQPEGVHLPLEDESADLVVLSSVFTHMRRESIEQYLREIRRILSQEGIVAFSYFHSSFFGNNEDYRVRFPDNPDRMTFFSTREMRRLLSAGGLSAIRQVNYNGHFNSTDTFFQTFMFARKSC